MIKRIMACTLCCFLLQMLEAQSAMQTKPLIIPEPASVAYLASGAFSISAQSELYAPTADAQKSAKFFNDYLFRYYGYTLPVATAAARSKNSIRFEISPNAKEPLGAYRMQVGTEQIILQGANPQGLFYAMQTLIQLLPLPYTQRLSLSIPALNISDTPRFEYRGMHLDVVRHIFQVSYIKRYIDYLALHKLNYFHWHLTDDQGWRMESKSHPLLNEKGAYREGSIIGLFPGTGVDSTRYGGYYTIAEMKEIVAYAADRYITIIPEIDVPGHSMAVLATYPQFSTTPNEPKKPAITWGIFNRQNNVLLPSPEVFAFLEDVFGELMEVFPSPYIHIGGDECAKKWWKESEYAQSFMREKGLKDEDELQAYFIRHLSNYVRSKGRIMIGWDEILQGGLPQGAVVMSWQGVKGGVEAAKQGHKAIMTPMLKAYMNVSQLKNDTHLAHRGYVPIDTVYTFDPIPRELTAEQGANILGGQCCMWTEYFETTNSIEYAIFPRLSAAAEVYWTPKAKRNLSFFMEKLERQKNRYDLWGINYCKIKE